MFRPDPWAAAFIACAGAKGPGAFAPEALEYFKLYCRCALSLSGYLSGSTDAAYFAQAITNALVKSGTSSEAAELARRFIALLIRKGCLNENAKLCAAIEAHLNKASGTVRADIVAAFDVDDAFITELQTVLKVLYKAERVEIHARKDKSLIGGFVVKAESRLYDASIVSLLDKMRAELSRPTGSEE